MVGRELTNIYPPLDNTPGDVLLEVDNFTSIHSNSFKDCSFKLRRGEILGFGGLVGAQRTELMEAIFGIRHTTSGEVKLNGKPLNIKTPAGCHPQWYRHDHRGPSWNWYSWMSVHCR